MIVENLILELYIIENAVHQSDCIIFKTLISQKPFEVESLFFTCNKISMEAAVTIINFCWVWSGMPIVL